MGQSFAFLWYDMALYGFVFLWYDTPYLNINGVKFCIFIA